MNSVMTRTSVLLLILSLIFLTIPSAASAENPVTPQQEGWTIIEKEVPYGDGPGEVGAYSRGEGDFGGPKSFTVDDAGTIYVLDMVNKRVQVYSKNLDFLRSVNLSQIGGEDIAVDGLGNIYILYAGKSQIVQYDSTGKIISTVKLNSAHWRIIGGLPLYLIGNIFYIPTPASTDEESGYRLVGKIVGGVLQSPPPAEQDAVVKGMLLQSGRLFMAKGPGRIKKEATITDINGSERTIPIEGVPVGDDAKDNLYFQTDVGAINNRHFVKIMKHDRTGNLTGEVKMPLESWYPLTRHYLVDKFGNIYGMQTGEDRMLLTVARPN
jgi:hypothetical protein